MIPSVSNTYHLTLSCRYLMRSRWIPSVSRIPTYHLTLSCRYLTWSPWIPSVSHTYHLILSCRYCPQYGLLDHCAWLYLRA